MSTMCQRNVFETADFNEKDYTANSRSASALSANIAELKYLKVAFEGI